MDGASISDRRPAYAIFAGGGVKGAAFAGCLKAAEDFGFEFKGYGGTSAGSLIALLACVGYTADELQLITEEVPFASLMDDGGRGVKRLMDMKDNLSFGYGTARDLAKNARMLNVLRTKLGLYDGAEFRRFLQRMIHRKLPQLGGKPNITFADLRAEGCPSLKILASNISLRRECRYPDSSHGGYNDFVIDAVRASVSYPFVFRPERVHDRYLVDGGLSANLPFFLFEEERKDNPIPVLAFDLVTEPSPREGDYGIVKFSGDLLSTALESSQALQRQMIGGAHVYVIPVEVRVDTFDLELSIKQRRELFEAGREAAENGIEDFLFQTLGIQPLTRFGGGGRVQAPPEPQTQSSEQRLRSFSKVEYLRALYAPPRLVIPLLAAMIAEFRSEMGEAPNLRSYVLLRYDAGSLFVAYQHGFDGGVDLELSLGAGWGGVVWSEHLPVVANLDDLGNLDEQYKKLAENRKSLLAMPMFYSRKQTSAKNRPSTRFHEIDQSVVGALCLDSDVPGHASIWVEDMKFVALAKRWADIISRLLY